ncbi:response regulator transcription factor [Mitsuaria sp. WAJ17]|uniref:response regulator transcription factor n=1 Tax=Mitsuaria sp. WAJ17 TaxID=2761452 RepID=UPI002106C020|nr:response regulator [Mitsuaria sp. WAJ17]
MPAKRILIVDDQAETRRLVRWGLTDNGFTLHEAANAAGALQLARALHPDLVILDVVLPGETDGLALCRQFRADAELATLRVLILSANADPKDRLAAMDAGADAYLSKPFSPVELDRQVQALLSKT